MEFSERVRFFSMFHVGGGVSNAVTHPKLQFTKHTFDNKNYFGQCTDSEWHHNAASDFERNGLMDDRTFMWGKHEY